jgi:hypothetical protein
MAAAGAGGRTATSVQPLWIGPKTVIHGASIALPLGRQYSSSELGTHGAVPRMDAATAAVRGGILPQQREPLVRQASSLSWLRSPVFA